MKTLITIAIFAITTTVAAIGTATTLGVIQNAHAAPSQVFSLNGPVISTLASWPGLSIVVTLRSKKGIPSAQAVFRLSFVTMFVRLFSE